MKNTADNLQMQEAEFERLHKSDTDEELIAYLVKCSKELGRCPKKEDVIGHTYLKQRFGPCPCILERARLENEFAQKHANDTDAELYELLKELKAKHGKRLNPTNTI